MVSPEIEKKEFVENRETSRVKIAAEMKISEIAYSDSTIGPVDAVLVDISSSGILAEARAGFEVESLLKLEIKLPRWEKYKNEFFKFDSVSISKPLIAVGKVTRVWQAEANKHYIGIEFLNIDPDHYSALKRRICEVM
jgi:c-di-GMP-binding flagellar brake protein YcgR